MKKLFITQFITLLFSYSFTLSAKPNDNNTLFIYSKSSSSPIQFSLDELNKLTFNDDAVQLWKQDIVAEIPFSDFLMFSFSEQMNPQTGIEQSKVQGDVKAVYHPGRNSVIVNSEHTLNGISVYDLQGRIVASALTPATSYTISIHSLPHGIYFVKALSKGNITQLSQALFALKLRTYELQVGYTNSKRYRPLTSVAKAT